MRFDLVFRHKFRDRLEEVAQQLAEREQAPLLDSEQGMRLRAAVQPFCHTTSSARRILYAGCDGTGEYPAVAYGDSFVHVTLAQATCYQTDSLSGLREVAPIFEPVAEPALISEDSALRVRQFEEVFARLAGYAVEEVIACSDYRVLKAAESRRTNTVAALRKALILPHAADAGNIAIQLRSTGELGAALRTVNDALPPHYLLLDGTLSLPLVTRVDVSLFYEHLKRLCCVEARGRGVRLLALSKSHGLPSSEPLEEAARDVMGLATRTSAEHWFLRVPSMPVDGWELSLVEGKRLPPAGAVTYFVRFHQSTPVMRIDMDRVEWETKVRGTSEQETRARERTMFQELDYACHDQRSFGYPYVIKAAHDRASLTQAERQVLRRQFIDLAVQAGMKRSLFRDPAVLTGHE